MEKHETAKQVTDDNITWRMRFACWINKAAHTLRICNAYCFSTATIASRTHPIVTLYVYRLFSYVITSGNDYRFAGYTTMNKELQRKDTESGPARINLLNIRTQNKTQTEPKKRDVIERIAFIWLRIRSSDCPL